MKNGCKTQPGFSGHAEGDGEPFVSTLTRVCNCISSSHFAWVIFLLRNAFIRFSEPVDFGVLRRSRPRVWGWLQLIEGGE